MSTTGHKGLLDALLAVQQELPHLQKDKINPHFKSKFISLDTLMDKTLPVLTKHGLVWTTLPCRDGSGEPALRYRLMHAATGEACEDTMPLMLAKNDPQGQGSAITYARRYSLMAVLGLVADEDDDGNKASRRTSDGQRANREQPVAETLTAQQRERVLHAIADADQNEQLVLAAVGVEGAEDLTTAHAVQIRKLLDDALDGR